MASAPAAFIGTPAYMSPEQVSGKQTDRASGRVGVRMRALRDAYGQRSLPRRKRGHDFEGSYVQTCARVGFSPAQACTPRCRRPRRSRGARNRGARITASSTSSNWSTAQSAATGGGMSALIAAAKKEGTLNVIALPTNWANYGEELTRSPRSTASKSTVRIRAARALRRSKRSRRRAAGRPRRTSSTSAVRSRRRAPAQICSRRTRSQPGRASRPTRRSRTAAITRTTADSSRSAAT